MERNECERLLEKKFRELIDIYHQYNPDGTYLSATYMDEDGAGTVKMNNRCWHFDDEMDMEDGEDVNLPISFSKDAHLKIEEAPHSSGMVQKIVTGWTGEEFEEISKMFLDGDKDGAQERALEILDNRNGNIGRCWHNGYGIYGFRVGENGCTFTVGTSCD